MKNQFVTYEIAKKLKELGFNEPCISEFTIMKDDIKLHLNNHFNTNEKIEPNLPAPLWQQAVEFLKEKYGYRLVLDGRSTPDHYYSVYKNGEPVWKTYELERAILKVIELI